MPSTALLAWRSARATRLDRLVAAHATVGGSGPGRRWLTGELNDALILRLAAEFQGYARDLHNEAAKTIVSSLAPGDPQQEDVLRDVFTTGRGLDRGNADPDTLRRDFKLFGLDPWLTLQQRFPTRAGQWRARLALLTEARNGLAHADRRKIERVAAAGWPITLQSARRWRSTLDTLATELDRVTGEHLGRVFGATAW